jgi:hypothetical protein
VARSIDENLPQAPADQNDLQWPKWGREPAPSFRDGINVAARLEALAEPGAICVSATVREHRGLALGSRH